MQLSISNLSSGSVLRNSHNSTRADGLTSIQGSMAWAFTPVILSPNFCLSRSRTDMWRVTSKVRGRMANVGRVARLERQRDLLRERIVAGGPRSGGCPLLTQGADPVEIAPLPDVRKADHQDGKERDDIDDREPGELPAASMDRRLGAGQGVARRNFRRERRRHGRGRQWISDAEFLVHPPGLLRQGDGAGAVAGDHGHMTVGQVRRLSKSRGPRKE